MTIDLVLSQEQVRVKNRIEELAEPNSLLILRGLSGIGKSTVLEQFGHEVVELHSLEKMAIENDRGLTEEYAEHDVLLTSALPIEGPKVETVQNALSDRRSHIIDMKAMSAQEISAFANRNQQFDVVRYSIGIPLLAEILSQDNPLICCENSAAEAAAVHLRYSVHTLEDALPFLSMPIPEKTANCFRILKSERLHFKDEEIIEKEIYDIGKRINHCEKQGEELKYGATFVTQHSQQVHVESLKRDFEKAYIHVPAISRDQMRDLKYELNFKLDENGGGGGTLRWKVFGVHSRKFQVYGEEGDWKFGNYRFDIEHSKFKGVSQELPLQNDGNFSLTFSFGDHASAKIKTIMTNWMIESLLQNMSIGYIASGLSDKAYSFDPKKNSIAFLPYRLPGS